MVNPVSIHEYDAEGRPLASIQATSGTATTSAGSLLSMSALSLSSLATTQSGYTSWTANQYSKTRLVKTAVYFSIPSTTSTDSNGFVGTMGTLGVSGVSTGNYDMTQYGYESFGGPAGVLMGRRNKTIGPGGTLSNPGGTITCMVLDVLGHVTATWIGTNDFGATRHSPLARTRERGSRHSPLAHAREKGSRHSPLARTRERGRG